MKKNIILLVILLVAYGFNSTVDADEVYTIQTDGQQIISVKKKQAKTGLKEFDIVMPDNLPEDFNKKEAVQRIFLEKKPSYLYQKQHEITNIFPWKFKQGESFKVFLNDKKVKVEKIEAKKDNELPNQIKKSFYSYFMAMLIIFILASLGGVVLESGYKKIGSFLLLCAVAFAFAVACNIIINNLVLFKIIISFITIFLIELSGYRFLTKKLKKEE